VQGLLDLAVAADAALADPDVGAVVGHQRGAGVPEGALVVGEIHGRQRAGAPRLLEASPRVAGWRSGWLVASRGGGLRGGGALAEGEGEASEAGGFEVAHRHQWVKKRSLTGCEEIGCVSSQLQLWWREFRCAHPADVHGF
jgi:hypothetical protein